MDRLIDWAEAHPWQAAIAAGPTAALLLGLIIYGLRTAHRAVRKRATLPVIMATIGAVLATGLSSDTAWRFAARTMDIEAVWERAVIFAVGEISLLTFALAARANLHDPEKGRTGVPGVMVWVTCGALAIPAIDVSDSLPAATGRILLGPCAAAILWHMAMGIELRQSKPKAASTSFLAILAGELRARTLARFGLAEANRSAEAIIRERALNELAALQEEFHDPNTGKRRRTRMRHRLQRLVLKSGVATDPAQRKRLEQVRAYLSHAAGPPVLPSPWEEVEPDPTVTGERVKGEEDLEVKGELVNAGGGLHPEPEVKTRPGVNADEGVKMRDEEPAQGEADQAVNAAGLHQEAAAFTLHPERAAGAYEPHQQPMFPGAPHQQPAFPGAYERLHSSPQPSFTPVAETSSEVSPVVPEVARHGEATVSGQSDDMSIRRAWDSPAPAWDAGEGLHPEPEVKETSATVPLQSGAVDAPAVSSPQPTVKTSEEVKAGEGLHPRAGVNADELVKASADEPASSGEDGEVKTAGDERIGPERAREIIEQAWWGGTKTNAETAREAQRSAAYVTKVWKALEKDHGARPAPD